MKALTTSTNQSATIDDHTDDCGCDACFTPSEAVQVYQGRMKRISLWVHVHAIHDLKTQAKRYRKGPLGYQELLRCFVYQGLARPWTYPLT